MLEPQGEVMEAEEEDLIEDITLPWPMILYTYPVRWEVEVELVLMKREAEVEVSWGSGEDTVCALRMYLGEVLEFVSNVRTPWCFSIHYNVKYFAP